MAGLLSRFGGVWKSFAVELPTGECFDDAGRYVVFDASSGKLSIWAGLIPTDLVDWWWLDRRIPKSLLPEEAFDLAKILHPSMTCLRRTKVPSWSVLGGHDRIPVEWGGRGAYMPDSEGQWVEITRDNWLAYLHWDCEYGFEDGRDMGDSVGIRNLGVLSGMDKHGRFLVLFKDGLGISSSVRVKVGVDGKSVLAAEGGK